jgi:hypothetical protein
LIQKNENVSLKKKITMICKSKPKPKGCWGNRLINS